jgi:hypothetical protein
LDIPMGKLITNFSDSTHKLTLSFNRNNWNGFREFWSEYW